MTTRVTEWLFPQERLLLGSSVSGIMDGVSYRFNFKSEFRKVCMTGFNEECSLSKRKNAEINQRDGNIVSMTRRLPIESNIGK